MGKPKVAFVCVHNSCRSQIAEALGKKLTGLDRDGSYVLNFLYVSHSNSAISFKSGKYMRFDDKISEKENRGCRNLQPLLLEN